MKYSKRLKNRKRKKLTIHIDPKLFIKIKHKANENNKSISSIIMEALNNYYDE